MDVTSTKEQGGVEQVEHAPPAVKDTEVAPEAVGGPDTSALPRGYYRSPKFIGTIIATSLMCISLYLGYVLPVNILSIINEDIGPDPSYILIPITKTLGGGVGLLLVGRLGDIFGRRWVYIIGQLLGTIGSIMAATTNSINVLMGATAFIGVAGAAQTGFSILIQELVPNNLRGLVIGLQFVITFPFAAFGPLFARLLVLHTAVGWRWCYYMNLITCGLSAILFFIFYHPPNYGLLHQGKSLRRELLRLDFGGLVLYCGGLIALLLGLSWGGGVYPWTSPKVIGTIVGGAVTIVVFGFYEKHMPLEHPLLPLSVIKSRNFIALCITGSVATVVYYSMNVLWPSMISALFTTDSITVGWYSVALGGSVAAGQISGGLTILPIKKMHWQIRISVICITTFTAALAAAGVGKNKLAIALTTLSGFSVGYVELLAIIMVPFTVDAADIGLSSGFQASCRSVAGTIATAIFSTVLANKNKSNIPREVGPAAIAAGLKPSAVPAAIAAAELGAPKAYSSIPGINAHIENAIVLAVKVAKAQSFKTMFLVSLAFGLTSTFASFFIGSVDSQLTKEIARKLQMSKTRETGNKNEEV